MKIDRVLYISVTNAVNQKVIICRLVDKRISKPYTIVDVVLKLIVVCMYKSKKFQRVQIRGFLSYNLNFALTTFLTHPVLQFNG